MKKADIYRAWRDKEFYNSLSDEERAQLPANPAGIMDLQDEALSLLTGGCGGSGCINGSFSTSPGTAICTNCPCICH